MQHTSQHLHTPLSAGPHRLPLAPLLLLCPFLSCQVIAVARLLSEGRAWAVRGNNDDLALATWWNLQQRIAPPLPKLSWVGQILPEDVQFMMGLPFSVTVEG